MYQPNSVPPDPWPWYAVHCQRLKEWQAAAALETLLGLAVYVPEIRRRSRGRVQHAPFFPGYIFVRANFTIVASSKINATPGVLRLVAFDNRPLAIPEPVIDQIYTQVTELNAHGGMLIHRFQPGDTVRLKVGPFRGLEAQFLGPMKPSERVQVLIEFLGSLREADVRIDDLEGVGAAPIPRQPERRSRGKGRPIKRY
jgi:transcriptional antiterminator RfaH